MFGCGITKVRLAVDKNEKVLYEDRNRNGVFDKGDGECLALKVLSSRDDEGNATYEPADADAYELRKEMDETKKLSLLGTSKYCWGAYMKYGEKGLKEPVLYEPVSPMKECFIGADSKGLYLGVKY